MWAIPHPEWTQHGIAYLQQNPIFRRKLHSDSTADVNKKKRHKDNNKESKIALFGVLAGEGIFDSVGEDAGVDVDDELRKACQEHPNAFAKSTQQQWARILCRLKSKYTSYVKWLKETGGGVEDSDEYKNILAKIHAEWPFWDDLHLWWKELPNYNPIEILNSTASSSHAANAAAIFDAQLTATDADDRLDMGSSFDDTNEASSTPSRWSLSPPPSTRCSSSIVAKATQGTQNAPLPPTKSKEGKKTKYGGLLASSAKQGFNAIANLGAEAECIDKRHADRDKLRAWELDIKLECTKLERRKIELEAQARAHNSQILLQMMSMVAGSSLCTLGASPSFGTVSHTSGASSSFGTVPADVPATSGSMFGSDFGSDGLSIADGLGITNSLGEESAVAGSEYYFLPE
ncbi:uncharacterized protein PHACADRAFT_33447 [Phanerochaete carnosa HHB-10118-sp]|uniref:Uncharacterized protein n=1 Tax=Phanerochaete carnosa (strain HHB-10118-sp) TaxID=650164 RepID=K5WGR4_PHACS|nr:uncharacterized protein PHACADRAFT_33447 [Phanerochaete carnosa HHB-10118-sp]EKM49372.1 hypothetical protein PHACADRAFT_33447 [Phanerochaete carnosa HHB-10118-sp]